jgi:hypothetical protein
MTIGDIEMKRGAQDDQECIDEPWKKPAAASESAQGDLSTFPYICKVSYFFARKKNKFVRCF